MWQNHTVTSCGSAWRGREAEMMVSASPKLCRKDLQQQRESQPRLPRVGGGSKSLQMFRIRRLSRKTEKCPTWRLHTDRTPNMISCLNSYSSEWFVWFLSHFAFNTKRCCTFICVSRVCEANQTNESTSHTELLWGEPPNCDCFSRCLDSAGSF